MKKSSPPEVRLYRAVQRCLKHEDPRGLWNRQKDDLLTLADQLSGPMPEATLDDIPREQAVHYACRDADATWRIAGWLDSQIRLRGLEQARQDDIGAIPLMARMCETGMLVNPAHFHTLREQAERDLTAIEDTLVRTLGFPFNPGSPLQTARVIYNILGLKGSRRHSTEDKYLRAMKHPVAALICEWREIRKLITSFLDPLPNWLDEHHRLHPDLRLTNTVTGRPAAKGFNVLALPKHSVRGQAFRRGFVAPGGFHLGAWDLSQIELRVLAHLSGDRALIGAFVQGVDLHAQRAEQIFGVPAAQQDETKHRLPVKAVNFGIPMGITKVGLKEQLHKQGLTSWTEDDCQKLIDDTLDAWPGVAAFMEHQKAQAREYGWVRSSISGRIFHVPGAQSPHEEVRAGAERESHALPIQEGNATIMKRWMARLHDWTVRARDIEPWLWIHDDVLWAYDPRHESFMQVLHHDTLRDVTAFMSVPVTSKHVVGPNWADMEKPPQ